MPEMACHVTSRALERVALSPSMSLCKALTDCPLRKQSSEAAALSSLGVAQEEFVVTSVTCWLRARRDVELCEGLQATALRVCEDAGPVGSRVLLPAPLRVGLPLCCQPHASQEDWGHSHWFSFGKVTFHDAEYLLMVF